MLDFLKNIYNTYINKQMLILLALGFSSGFPYPLVFGTLSLWLSDLDISLMLIGYFSLVKIPYSLKWVWSPFIDNLKIPFLYKIGRRRSWALLIQISLFISIICMACINPQSHTLFMAFFALLTSFLSASQDIVLDAYRVESFEKYPEKQASGVAIFVLGYRIGLIFSGAGAIYMASIYSWSTVYCIMSMGIFLGILAMLLAKENTVFKYKKYEYNFLKFFHDSVINPFKDFINREHWYWIIALIFTYHLSNAYFNPVINPFYNEMGFSKEEIAKVLKLFGMVAAIIGGLTGGIIINKIKLKNSMIYFCILQCLSTLLFSLQAYFGHNMPLFIIVITVESFCSGLATTALVAYISNLCNKKYTATQYALLSSVMSISRDIFSSTSGVVALYLGWELFFVFSACLSLPALVIIIICLKNIK